LLGSRLKVVGIHLRPHDLRGHSATYASRSGVPIEIVSVVCNRKVLLKVKLINTGSGFLCHHIVNAELAKAI
jgi:hypothetical protein